MSESQNVSESIQAENIPLSNELESIQAQDPPFSNESGLDGDYSVNILFNENLDGPPTKKIKLNIDETKNTVIEADPWIPPPISTPRKLTPKKLKFSPKTKRNIFGSFPKWLSPRKIKKLNSPRKTRKIKNKKRNRKNKKLATSTKNEYARRTELKRLAAQLEAKDEKMAKLEAKVQAFEKIFNQCKDP